LLSYSIPIVAIQASLLRVGDQEAISFTKILDTYEEVDDGTSVNGETFDRNFWLQKARWTVEAADALASLLAGVFVDPGLNYLKHYVAVTVSGSNYLSLRKKAAGKSLLCFRMSPAFQDEVARLLDEANITYVRKPNEFQMTVDADSLKAKPDLFRALGGHIKRHWE
jgi:hypothetical protein